MHVTEPYLYLILLIGKNDEMLKDEEWPEDAEGPCTGLTKQKVIDVFVVLLVRNATISFDFDFWRYKTFLTKHAPHFALRI